MHKSFIEEQFPVSRISKESYKERMSVSGQTLTGLGKWWGRKPLILIRSAILGLLMPSSSNPKKDKEIFLKILTMDKKGLLKRRNKPIPPAVLYEYLTTKERAQYLTEDNKFNPDISPQDKEIAIEKAWNRMTYDHKLKYCCRPEEYTDKDPSTWKEINDHLGTDADNLQDLISQLGTKIFGKRPTVGDCFCGGGSIPFEAARMGCDVYASDLNPIAGLLTWSALNISGASSEEIEKLKEFRKEVYDKVNKQVLEWGIETNEQGDRADSYLYCCETICPECSYMVPLAPSWIIGKRTKTIAILKENNNRFDIEIKSNADPTEVKYAESLITVRKNYIYCPHCKKSTPIQVIRKDKRNIKGEMEYGLRKWEKHEFIPGPFDVFQERLYCIRYQREYSKNGKTLKERYYTAPSPQDLEREQKVIDLLSERFKDWQEKGYIPSDEIEPGEKTNEPIRTRGWTHWHHLFNPRQLLLGGCINFFVNYYARGAYEYTTAILGINKLNDYNSKLSQWDSSVELVNHTFYNQALNTNYTFGSKSSIGIITIWNYKIKNNEIRNINYVRLYNANNLSFPSHIWITDPPYADAINYHELSEFFLAWDRKLLNKAFPEWYSDSKRVLAIKGKDEEFTKSMIEVYTNLARNMPDNGYQIIMFTHQDVNVWADLTLIVWSSGLQVVSAWNIATETESGGLKQGNYIKGTVLLVLKKQVSERTAYIDDIYPDIEEEVKKQIESMRNIDDLEEPNFSDPDYILAAYAASLKILTSYKKIEDIDIAYELSRKSKEKSPIAKLIESAKKIAYDQLIPLEFDKWTWMTMISEERYYIKGLELEKNKIYKMSGYQELARGFGVRDYRDYMENSRANTARLKTPQEWGARNIKSDGFGSSMLRNVFMALYLSERDEPIHGRNWLRSEITDYWHKRERTIEMLKFIAGFTSFGHLAHWHKSSELSGILIELVKNDSI